MSGGMDSMALAFWKRPELALFIDYGQAPAKAEWLAANYIADLIGIPIRKVTANCSAVGSGGLSGRTKAHCAPTPEWWPYRNQLLATISAGYSVNNGYGRILFGSVLSDKKNGDGSKRFFAALNRAFSIQPGGVKVLAPAVSFSALQLIRKSRIPIHFLRLSYSCHSGNNPCGKCRGCTKQTRMWKMLSHPHAGELKEHRANI